MALKSIKVIELGGLAPAPFCGMILADFGASVLRIDKIGANTQLDSLGHGKKSLALNLKTPQGVKVLKDLCKRSDVLIEPYRAGVMESLGLGPDILLKENKKLIYSRLTGFGQTGPWSKRAGHDINYIALSGLLSLFGRHGDKPVFPINTIADFGGGGLMCALGITMALFERSISGQGQVVDANMVEGSAYLGSWLFRSQNLPIWGQERGKNILDTGAHFYEVYETKDGKYMSVGAIESNFYKLLLKGLELDEEQAPQFGDFDELKEVFKQQFLKKTQEEWCKIFDNLDACVAPILSIDDVANYPHNKDSFVDDFHKTVKVPTPAPRLSRTPASSKGILPLPEIGEHTMSVLRELNYSEQHIQKLEEEGIIGIHRAHKL